MAATEIAWSGLTWRLHPDHRLRPTKMCQDHLGGAFRECDNMYVLQHQMVIVEPPPQKERKKERSFSVLRQLLKRMRMTLMMTSDDYVDEDHKILTIVSCLLGSACNGGRSLYILYLTSISTINQYILCTIS